MLQQQGGEEVAIPSRLLMPNLLGVQVMSYLPKEMLEIIARYVCATADLIEQMSKTLHVETQLERLQSYCALSRALDFLKHLKSTPTPCLFSGLEITRLCPFYLFPGPAGWYKVDLSSRNEVKVVESGAVVFGTAKAISVTVADTLEDLIRTNFSSGLMAILGLQLGRQEGDFDFVPAIGFSKPDSFDPFSLSLCANGTLELSSISTLSVVATSNGTLEQSSIATSNCIILQDL